MRKEAKKTKKKLTAIALLALFFLESFQTPLASEYAISDSDIEFLARAVEKTAPEASYVARLAFCAMIVNRRDDPRFPSDLRAVVYQRGEFDCARAPDLETCSPSRLSRLAARDALLGFDPSGGALYYKKGHRSESYPDAFFHSGFWFFTSRP